MFPIFVGIILIVLGKLVDLFGERYSYKKKKIFPYLTIVDDVASTNHVLPLSDV